MAEFDPNFYGNATPPPFYGGVRDVDPTVGTQAVAPAESQVYLQSHGYTDAENNPSIFQYMRHAIDSIPSPENELPSLTGMGKEFLHGVVGAMEGTQTGDISPKDVIALGVGMGGINIGRAAIEGGLSAEGLKAATETPGMFFANIPKRSDLLDIHNWWTKARETANSMEAAGATKEQINSKLALSKDIAGNWRVELPDNAFSMTSEAKDQINKMLPGEALHGNFNDFFSHPILERIHPEVRNYKITVNKHAEDTLSAVHQPGHITMDLGPHYVDTQGNMVPTSWDHFKGVALHELQHFAQDRDAQAGIYRSLGANPKNVLSWAKASIEDKVALGQVDEAHKYALQLKNLIDTASPYFLQRMEHYNVEGPYTRAHQSYQAYEHIFGEAEARVTERSQAMTAAERRASHPDERLNVPREMLIDTPAAVHAMHPEAINTNTVPTMLEKSAPATGPKTFGKRHLSESGSIEDADALHHLLKLDSELASGGSSNH